MIPASMSVDGEHAATYRQQHGSPNIFFSLDEIFSSKNLQRECSCYWQNKRLTRFDTDSLQKYVWLLKFIEGQANEYTSNHGFKPLSPALTLVPVSTYHGKWVLIQPIIPKEGSTPARMKASTNVSTNSQLMGDAGYTPFFIWFCSMHIKQSSH